MKDHPVRACSQAHPSPRNLAEFIGKAREFLEPLWIKTHATWANEPVPSPSSKYMCRYSCLFLQQALKDAGYGQWTIRLGRPPSPELNGTKAGMFGYQSGDGCFHDHAWLTKDGLMIDITADQYGDLPIIIGNATSVTYKSNLTEHEAAKELDVLRDRAKAWYAEFQQQD